MPQEYKVLKEAFVSNLYGGSISEINTITLVAPAAVLLWSVLQSRRRFFTRYTLAAGLTDFLLNCGAILLATTLYGSAPLRLNALLLVPAIGLYNFSSRPYSRPHAQSFPPAQDGSKQRASGEKDALPLKPFVTHYRGTMMVITCIAILAVDFRVFPRRFAKVENWGTSLMDLGVGSFVFAAGVVAARPILKERLTGRTVTLAHRMRASLLHSIPLLVLGFIRLYSVKGLDYAEHVTEYGVHWNFFFTLGCLPPFVALIESVANFLPSYALISLFVALAYEGFLDGTDLKAYILTAPRTGLLSKNREGIFSFFGYLAIFLAGQATGLYILPRRAARPTSSSTESALRRSILLRLFMWSVIWTVLFAVSVSHRFGLNLNVSRRLANLPYCLWVCSFNCFQIALFCGIETLCFPSIHTAKDMGTEESMSREATSTLLHAFNRNGLAIFLLANLLTGAVNMTMPTLTIGELPAMAVLVVYIGVLDGVALLLDRYNISVKL